MIYPCKFDQCALICKNKDLSTLLVKYFLFNLLFISLQSQILSLEHEFGLLFKGSKYFLLYNYGLYRIQNILVRS